MPIGDNFGYIYDWMEEQDLPEGYDEGLSGSKAKSRLLKRLYDEMTRMTDNPLDFAQWSQTYGKYFDLYNPAQEELTEEAFDIKVGQTEKLFDLKTDQLDRDYDLIEKYSSIDDSDDFESITEMDIRHADETDKIEQKVNRLKLISEGINLDQKKKIARNKSLMKNIRTGDTDRIVSELDETFWNNMKVVRSEYDKQRLNRTQALDDLILKADQTVENALRTKTDNLDTLLATSEGNLKNAALDLIDQRAKYTEGYSDELWDTMGELAAGDAFVDTCDPPCPEEEFCFRGECIGHYSYIEINEDTAGFDHIKNQIRMDPYFDGWVGWHGELPEIKCSPNIHVKNEDGTFSQDEFVDDPMRPERCLVWDKSMDRWQMILIPDRP